VTNRMSRPAATYELAILGIKAQKCERNYTGTFLNDGRTPGVYPRGRHDLKAVDRLTAELRTITRWVPVGSEGKCRVSPDLRLLERTG